MWKPALIRRAGFALAILLGSGLSLLARDAIGSAPSSTTRVAQLPSGPTPTPVSFVIPITCPPVLSVVATIAYPPGWNLIGGPPGSCLSGAGDPIYGIAPGPDAEHPYATIITSPTLPLPPGATWAYFPDGGSLALVSVAPSPGHGACIGEPAGPLLNGGWVPITNQDPIGDAIIVSGASELLLYEPSNGYVETDRIPPGRGAWALADGHTMIELAAADSGGSFPNCPPQQ